MPWHTEQSKVCCTHMPRHTFSDHRTTVWGVYMPRHTQSSQRTTMWGTYIPRHTLRGQRTTGGVGHAHSKAHMQDRGHCVGCAHARACMQGSGDHCVGCAHSKAHTGGRESFMGMPFSGHTFRGQDHCGWAHTQGTKSHWWSGTGTHQGIHAGSGPFPGACTCQSTHSEVRGPL